MKRLWSGISLFLSISIVLAFFTAVPLQAVQAKKIVGENILVSGGNMLYEYTPSGTLVRQVPIPPAPGCCGISRDLISIGDDRVAVYNGTFSPLLSIIDGDGAWNNRTAPGWSTANNVSYGGITFYGNSILVTDMETAGEGAPNGIVAFNLSDGTWTRYFAGQDFDDIYMGLNHKLYALKNTYGDLLVINPATMEVEYTLDLGFSSGVRGVAVNAAGHIYATSWDGNIHHYDSSANLLDSFNPGQGSLTDIDLDVLGRIVTGTRIGKIVLTDENFSPATIIDVDGVSGGTFVTFAGTGVPPSATPWRDNAPDDMGKDMRWHYAMGYHFTPLTNGVVSKIGGYFNGTRKVRLFNKGTGLLLAETTVTANNDWQYGDITPVNVQQGVTYTVAVYLEGSGGSYSFYYDRFPAQFDHIRIEGSTYTYTGNNPDARPTGTHTLVMFGQADIVFTPQD